MKHGKEINLQCFGRADTTPPAYPKRSLLFQIPPIAVGTEDVESFTGYLNRIAFEHCVSAGQMIKFCLDKNEKYGGKSPYFSRCLNGINHSAELVADVIKEATLINEIRFTNLSPLQNIISNIHSLKQEKAWCPACINNDVEKNGTTYERLIWNLEIVEVCSVHKTRLFTECPHCSRTGQHNYSFPYGFCASCRNWLGDSLKRNTVYKGRRKFTPKLMWIEKEVRHLIKLIPAAENVFRREKFLDALFHLVMSRNKGNISHFCRGFNLTEFDFISLFTEGNLISLRKLAAICYPLNISLVLSNKRYCSNDSFSIILNNAKKQTNR